MLFATSYPNSCTLEKAESPMEFQTFSKNKLTAEINDAVGQSGTSNPRYFPRLISELVLVYPNTVSIYRKWFDIRWSKSQGIAGSISLGEVWGALAYAEIRRGSPITIRAETFEISTNFCFILVPFFQFGSVGY